MKRWCVHSGEERTAQARNVASNPSHATISFSHQYEKRETTAAATTEATVDNTGTPLRFFLKTQEPVKGKLRYKQCFCRFQPAVYALVFR